MVDEWYIIMAEGQAEAVAALWTLAANNAENQVAIVAAGALAPLVSLLSHGTPEGQTRAVAAR